MTSLIRIETEDALRSFLASIVESSDDAIIGTALDGRIVSWNQGARQIYGYAADEVVGRSLAVLALPERSDEVAQMLGKIHRGERIRHFETMHLCRDGRVISVSLSISPVIDSLRRVIGASTIARDVTRRIRYEESLREAEQKYRLLFSAETDAIVVTEAESGRVVDFNEAACRLYDYPPEAFARLGLDDLVQAPVEPEADVVPSAETIRRIPQQRHRKRDGTLFSAELSISPFVWKGRPMQVRIVRDISELQRSRELRRSLRLASEIQQHLLPKQAPQPAGFDIAASSRYCEATGGDYFDFVPVMEDGEELLGCVVGDVSGHGLPAALLMAMAKGVLRAEVEHFGADLEALLGSMNRHFFRHLGDDRFMTLFFGLLHPARKTLRWNSAAHGPVFWYRSALATIEELPTCGPPLGTLETAEYRLRGPVTLLPGDVLLIGTDGIWEACSPAGEMFGTGRLRQVLASWCHRSAADIRSAVLDRVHAFCGPLPAKDDITLMVVKAISSS